MKSTDIGERFIIGLVSALITGAIAVLSFLLFLIMGSIIFGGGM